VGPVGKHRLSETHDRAAEIGVQRAERVDDVIGEREGHGPRRRDELARTPAPRREPADMGNSHLFLRE
jgi:hypothetical protein